MPPSPRHVRNLETGHWPLDSHSQRRPVLVPSASRAALPSWLASRWTCPPQSVPPLRVRLRMKRRPTVAGGEHTHPEDTHNLVG